MASRSNSGHPLIFTVTPVFNAEISARSGLPPVMDFIRRNHLSVFGHIARLTQGTPAHNALHCQVRLASGSLVRDWRRRPGHPQACWTDQLRNNLWRRANLQWLGGVVVGSWTRDRQIAGSIPGHGIVGQQPWASCSHQCASVYQAV